MPIDLPAMPAAMLKLATIDSAPAGSLLIANGRSAAAAPLLTWRDSNEDPQRPYVLPLATEGSDLHRAIVGGRDSGPWLAVRNWQLVVDPATAYLATDAMPALGDAFFSGDAAGFVGRFNHAEIYISTDGRMLPEPSWGSGYIGFRGWSITVDLGVPGAPHALIERTVRRTIAA